MSWNDGGVPIGGRKIKLYKSNGASDASGSTQWQTEVGIYIAEQNGATRGQKVSKRYDESGAPNGAYGVDDFVEGSATLQPAYTGTVLPDPGMAFTSARHGGGGNESWVLTSVDEPEEAGVIRKVGVRIQKLVVGPSGNWPTVYP